MQTIKLTKKEREQLAEYIAANSQAKAYKTKADSLKKQFQDKYLDKVKQAGGKATVELNDTVYTFSVALNPPRLIANGGKSLKPDQRAAMAAACQAQGFKSVVKIDIDAKALTTDDGAAALDYLINAHSAEVDQTERLSIK